MANVDIQSIDEVIHGRVRLGIMAYLAGAGSADFLTLKEQLQSSDGNLSVHLRKLEEAGYVTVAKSFREKRPHTEVQLSPQGREAFLRYLDSLRGLLGGTSGTG